MYSIKSYWLQPDKSVYESDDRLIATVELPKSAVPVHIGIELPTDDWPMVYCSVPVEDENDAVEKEDRATRKYEMFLDSEPFDPTGKKYRATVACTNGERVLHVLELIEGE